MKQNKNNRFAALLLALCMAVCCALPALAAPAASANIDLSRTGSMDVTLYDHQNDVPLRGGALTVYKVADVARTNGDLHFVYTADFTGCGIALGDLTDSTLASRLEAKLPARAVGTTIRSASRASSPLTHCRWACTSWCRPRTPRATRPSIPSWCRCPWRTKAAGSTPWTPPPRWARPRRR